MRLGMWPFVGLFSLLRGCVALEYGLHYKNGNVLDECPFGPDLPFTTLLTHFEELDSLKRYRL